MRSFNETFNGSLAGVLRWPQWDALLDKLRQDGHAWYAYAVGHGVPDAPISGEALATVLAEIDTMLRRDHDEDYLGIVYVDDPADPTMIKVYDPNHLGSSCGSGGKQIPPGWVLCRMPPEPIASDIPLPNNRRRWWQGVLERITGRAPH